MREERIGSLQRPGYGFHSEGVALGRHLSIIAMSASAMGEDGELCFAAGMDDFISKQ
jgi:CheY-like chemotaxis protein